MPKNICLFFLFRSGSKDYRNRDVRGNVNVKKDCTYGIMELDHRLNLVTVTDRRQVIDPKVRLFVSFDDERCKITVGKEA